VELNVQKGLSSAVANTNLLGINNFLDQVVDRSNSNFFFQKIKEVCYRCVDIISMTNLFMWAGLER
jgi:hypothetical protein